MQISKILKNKKVLSTAIALACASAIGFSAPAQACGGGGCKVVKYRYYYRSYQPCYRCYHRCDTCYRCNTCNYGCNTCNYGYSCNSCGYGGYYGGYYY